MKRQWLLVVCLARTCLGFQPPVVPPLAVRARSHTFLRDTTTTSELPEMEELPSMEPFTHVESPAPAENETMILDDININATIDSDLKMAPPLTFNKFLTMQDKRVVATIRYTNGLKPYYLTAAKKIKASHPDVVIEKRILPALAGDAHGDAALFEILVDDKIVVGNQRSRKQRGVGEGGDGSVYVSMQEMDLAISKARRKRRPSTLYGEEPSAGLRLEMLRKSREEETVVNGKVNKNKWND